MAYVQKIINISEYRTNFDYWNGESGGHWGPWTAYGTYYFTSEIYQNNDLYSNEIYFHDLNMGVPATAVVTGLVLGVTRDGRPDTSGDSQKYFRDERLTTCNMVYTPGTQQLSNQQSWDIGANPVPDGYTTATVGTSTTAPTYTSPAHYNSNFAITYKTKGYLSGSYNSHTIRVTELSITVYYTEPTTRSVGLDSSSVIRLPTVETSLSSDSRISNSEYTNAEFSETKTITYTSPFTSGDASGTWAAWTTNLSKFMEKVTGPAGGETASSRIIRWHSFGFNIPVGAIIRGCEVKILDRYHRIIIGSGTYNDENVRISNTDNDWSTYTANRTWPIGNIPAQADSRTPIYFGGDNWSSSLTPSIVNSDKFAIEYVMKRTGDGSYNTVEIYVDGVEVTIKYDLLTIDSNASIKKLANSVTINSSSSISNLGEGSITSSAHIATPISNTLTSEAYVIFVRSTTIDSTSVIYSPVTIHEEEIISRAEILSPVPEAYFDYLPALTSDTYIKVDGITETIDSDSAIVVAGITSDIDSDAVITDVFKRRENLDSDAWVYSSPILTLNSDMEIYFAPGQARERTSDAWIFQQGIEQQIDSDAYIDFSLFETLNSDAIISLSIQEDISSDSYLLEGPFHNLRSNSFIKETVSKTISSDSFVVFEGHEIISSSAFIVYERTKTITSTSKIFAPYSKTLNSTSRIKVLGNTRTINSAGFIGNRFITETLSSFSFVEKNVSKQLNSAGFIGFNDIEETLDSDSFLKKTNNKTLSSLSVIGKIREKTITSMAYVRLVEDAEIESLLQVKATSTETLDSDSKIVYRYDNSVVSDSSIKAAITKTIDSTMLIAEVSGWSDDVSIDFQETSTEIISSDMSVANVGNEETITSDAQIRMAGSTPFLYEGTYHNTPTFIYADADIDFGLEAVEDDGPVVMFADLDMKNSRTKK